MSEIDDLQIFISEFSTQREWEKFHSPKNLVMAITGEAGELASELQWISENEIITDNPQLLNNIKLEIADIGIYLLRLCDRLEIDFADAIREKLEINDSRFPKTK